jgi:hypothetical protein
MERLSADDLIWIYSDDLGWPDLDVFLQGFQRSLGELEDSILVESS